MKTKAQYYGISAAWSVETPIRRGTGGEWGTANMLRWHIYSGPCDTRQQAEHAGRTALPPMNANDTEVKTWHQNFKVVPASKLAAHRIDRNAEPEYADVYED
jgi:hypothetical protein